MHEVDGDLTCDDGCDEERPRRGWDLRPLGLVGVRGQPAARPEIADVPRHERQDDDERHRKGKGGCQQVARRGEQSLSGITRFLGLKRF